MFLEFLGSIKKAPFLGLFNGAGDENRTHVCSLEGCRSTIELHSHLFRSGVSEGNRTLDPLIKSQLLYHLSYRDISGIYGWGGEIRTHE